ncbi:heterokaryon incompatibility protein [Colletotrichum plurivorum]|uniref:Heterokaryon incompatibility protein n=1 Tax=Colletotrichum plurivorum TaxID=2175906 RepID=A0A8H6NBQ5_9PEZI|nr:heterokaryon incompatibility protein [Colletotrichum plurivorum]
MASSCPIDGAKHEYAPLETDQIRLVVLEPGRRSDPIRCRILAHQLKEALPYEAVSYTWGDETLTKDIQILPENYPQDAISTLAVSRSCVCVLEELRSAYSPRVLWIDAISINQASFDERSQQVRIMPSIYRSASQVTICLSRTPEDHTAAVDFISRGRFKNSPPESIQAAKRLFRHPWFSRTWVIQEVAKAREAVVLFDGHTIPWSNFALCARMLELNVPVMSPIRRLRQRGFIHTLSTDQFVKAISESTACECRDPRDRVFAFLSMYPSMMNKDEIEKYRTSGSPASGADKTEEEARGKGEVATRDSEAAPASETTEESNRGKMTNYAYSVETVYTQFATLLLKNVGLDFLSAMRGRPTTDTLPSWVPDWRVKGERTILAHLPLTEFNAGGHQDSQSFRILPPSPKTDMERLEVTAIHLGDIVSLGEPCDTQLEGWEEVVFRQWRDIAGSAAKEHRPKECSTKTAMSFIQTIMTDSDDEYVEARRSLCQKLLVPERKRQMTSKALLQGLDSEAATKLRISCHGRRLFVGPNGMIGLVASESCERDLVAVLPGARIPYTFRHLRGPSNSDVMLMGECFVAGMMRGEALSRGSSFLKSKIRIC